MNQLLDACCAFASTYTLSLIARRCPCPTRVENASCTPVNGMCSAGNNRLTKQVLSSAQCVAEAEGSSSLNIMSRLDLIIVESASLSLPSIIISMCMQGKRASNSNIVFFCVCVFANMTSSCDRRIKVDSFISLGGRLFTRRALRKMRAS